LTDCNFRASKAAEFGIYPLLKEIVKAVTQRDAMPEELFMKIAKQLNKSVATYNDLAHDKNDMIFK